MSESSFKCPHCGKQTFGVLPTRTNDGVICPSCLRDGLSIIMIEKKTQSIRHMGDGVYVKKNLSESVVI
jgi:DNA-directed RNA polymerase subunit RPC12/RpoP